MESKYLKLPLIRVDNLAIDNNRFLEKVSDAGLYLVTDGKYTELTQVYTCENQDGTINKWVNSTFTINIEDIFDTINEKPKYLELGGGDASFIPYGEYVSGETLLEIVKQITK